MEQQDLKPQDIVETDKNRVACDGGANGHPKIYLEFANAAEVICPYCGRRFVHPSKA